MPASATPKLLWLLVFVPVPLVLEHLAPESFTLLFLLSVIAIIPLAALLSLATEAVAARTGDAVGGLLNATLGNLTELIICLTALRAGEYVLVKASLAGAIVTNTLFMMGACFLIGGLRHRVQEFNLPNARLQLGMLFLAAFGLTVPSAITAADAQQVTQTLSLGVAILLIMAYGLGLVFSLGTHREFFSSAAHADEEQGTVAHAGRSSDTCGGHGDRGAGQRSVCLVADRCVRDAWAFRRHSSGFVIVALVGAAAEMATAFSAAAKNRLDLSVGIAFGSSAQIALFVAPVLVLLSYVIGPDADDASVLARGRRDDLHRRADGGAGDRRRALGLVPWCADADGLRHLRADAALCFPCRLA